MTKNAFLDMLAHEKTRTLMGRIAQGDDPRRAVADLAGQSLAEKVAAMLGAVQRSGEVADSSGIGQTAGTPRRPVTDSGITDAEFVVIDVSPGVKRRTAGR